MAVMTVPPTHIVGYPPIDVTETVTIDLTIETGQAGGKTTGDR